MVQEQWKFSNEEITCREVVAWTSAYLDEHVGEDRLQQIALHLAVCVGCGAYVKQIASVRGLVRLLPNAAERPAASEPLRQAFAARFRTRSQ
jgi:predicted anti-sigma-YlaC factor YlaD